ncbi:long-chain-fatty-acid--CoA ligase [Williamsia phyllosphaerae]|uniref:Fatty-acid-CoA synthetase FadD n=1 Tax=Williamsia phyllosphaerae TaxID=885042 RepID=A0ABQ1UNT6_9NOCA|nr:long-chain-fatty-acid--CoA ligase [Williamsia phyllosphaerae]GGF21721.1 putative fatty-acid-CoA synthetase FadD [Williamsia phyllosphaerae]
MTPQTIAGLLEPLANVETSGIWFSGEFVSWRDHLAQARHWASALRCELDPDRPPHVAVLLDNVVEFSVLLCAAAVDGLVLVGLNTTRRGAALARDIATADCGVVLTSPETAHLLDGTGIGSQTTVIDIASEDWADRLDDAVTRPARPRPEITPEQLMMLIFTSGTSGEPKAVCCDHRKFAAAGAMLAQRFGLDDTDVVYLSMPMFHSNAIIAGWSVAVAAGASIALRRTFSARGFLDDVRRYGVTYANYVGKPLSYVLATPEKPDDAESTLRIVYGNEASAHDIVAFTERFGVTVVDGFGSTEGGVAITRTPDTPPEALGPLVEPNAVVDLDTGRPCPTAVFDADGTLLNASEAIGEIVNADGAGLFTGYYRNPDAEAERMRGGQYHTGDLGYVDAEGYVYFAGRLGDWVRVDGENLATGPIERILLRHARIRLAAVYGVGTEIGDEIVASVVGDVGAEELTEFLSAQTDLGPKQWPTHVCLVEELPRTATFKVLKRELAGATLDPTWSLDRATRSYRPTR